MQFTSEGARIPPPAEAGGPLREMLMAVLHWYDRSPVGSYKVAAPDMEGLRHVISNLIDDEFGSDGR